MTETRGRVLWWCNGGIGDAVMMAPALRLLAKAGWVVDFYPQRHPARLVGELLGMLPGITVLGERPQGASYDVVACDTTRGALTERTRGLHFGKLVTPRSWGGRPSDWALDIIEQLDAKDNPGPPVFAPLLPHPRRPEMMLFGPGVGGNPKNQEKRWGGWVELAGKFPEETIGFVGNEDAVLEPLHWRWCPACKGQATQVTCVDPAAWKCAGPPACTWRVLDYIGKTPRLMDVLALFARTKLYVGVDNGLGHLAAECGVPTLTIFGATDPKRYLPRGHNSMALGAHSRFPTATDVDRAVWAFVTVREMEAAAC